MAAVSRAQREVLPDLNWRAVVHNGVDLDLFSFKARARREPYLIFLGRISPEKRPDLAIEVARATDLPLILAAKIDPADQGYFNEVVAPMLRAHPTAEYVGEVADEEKNDLLGGAYACLFPVDWPEPFGLTMVEAMAVGAPVIAMRRGAVAEVIAHGVTGFVCDSVEEMVEAVSRVDSLDRRACGERVERWFSVQRMSDAYERLYVELVGASARE